MIKDVLNTSPGKNKTIKNIKIALEHFFKRNKNKKHHTILLASLSLCRAFYNRYLRILWRKELCSWWYCVQNIQQVWWRRRRTENYSNQYIRNSKSQAEKNKTKEWERKLLQEIWDQDILKVGKDLSKSHYIWYRENDQLELINNKKFDVHSKFIPGHIENV